MVSCGLLQQCPLPAYALHMHIPLVGDWCARLTLPPLQVGVGGSVCGLVDHRGAGGAQ